MEAKKCDRCGNYYTIIDKPLRYKALTAAFLGAIASPLRLSNAQLEIEKILDLCPECTRDLTRWLKAKCYDESESQSEQIEALKEEINRLSYWDHMRRAAVIDEFVTRIKNAHGTVNIDDIAREMKEPSHE